VLGQALPAGQTSLKVRNSNLQDSRRIEKEAGRSGPGEMKEEVEAVIKG